MSSVRRLMNRSAPSATERGFDMVHISPGIGSVGFSAEDLGDGGWAWPQELDRKLRYADTEISKCALCPENCRFSWRRPCHAAVELEFGRLFATGQTPVLVQ